MNPQQNTYVYRFKCYTDKEELVEIKAFGIVSADRKASEHAKSLRDMGRKGVAFDGPVRFSGDVYGKSRFMLGKAIFVLDKWFVHLSNNEVRLIGSWPHGHLCTGRDEGKLIEAFLISDEEAEFVRFL